MARTSLKVRNFTAAVYRWSARTTLYVLVLTCIGVKTDLYLLPSCLSIASTGKEVHPIRLYVRDVKASEKFQVFDTTEWTVFATEYRRYKQKG